MIIQDKKELLSDFQIDLLMDWRLFQRQRRTLISLSGDERLSEVEQEHMLGILNLTDHIVDTAMRKGEVVPALEPSPLEQLAEAME